jgi:hypothetical protein
MNTPSETPLSDLITACATTASPHTLTAFMTEFRRSEVGIVAAAETPMTAGRHQSTAESSISIGLTRHTDGRQLALTYADPQAALKRFGPRFNAGMKGADILAAAFANPACEGVLVNSATSDMNIVISRVMAESPEGMK